MTSLASIAERESTHVLPRASPSSLLSSTSRILTSQHSTLASSLLDLRSSQPRTSIRLAHAYANRLRPQHIADLDLAQVLGGIEGDVPYGHSGCVNALHWTNAGTLLSGSDDTNVCIWEPTVDDNDDEDGPNVNMRLTGMLGTGHRANIFSVKTPASHPNRVFTAAGDNQVRVFDLNVQGRSSHSVIGRARGPEYTIWDPPPVSRSTVTPTGGACTQIFRCHKKRAKRLEAEIGGMSVLSVAEDGDVRQMDLRVPHTCPSCPPPLLHLPFTLYSLSIPTSAPHLLCVAGASPYAYLYDRRMIGREMSSEWGSVAAARFNPDGTPSEGMTRCVRRFGRESDKRGKGLSREDHVTAVKMSDWDGERLLVSYSSGGVHRFNVKDDPGQRHDEERQSNVGPSASTMKPKDPKPALDIPRLKRRTLRYLFGSGSRLSAASLSRKLDKVLGGSAHVDEEDRRWLSIAEAMVRLEQAQMACDPMSRKRLVEPDDCRAIVRRLRERTGDGSSLAGDGTDDELDEDLPGARQSLAESEEEEEDTGGRSISQHHVTLLIGMWKELEQAAGWENRREYRRVRQRIWSTSERLLRSWASVGDNEVDEVLDGFGEQRIGEAVAEGSTDVDGEMRSLQHWLDRQAEGDEESEEDDDSQVTDTSESEAEEHGDEDEEEDGDEDEEEEEEYNRRGVNLASIERGAPVITPRRVFTGHVNVETIKEVAFLGARDEYVVSGSDDGNFFIWSSSSASLLGVYKGDGSVPNVVQPHPHLPVLAVSGIDDQPKLFAPRPARRGKTEDERKWKRNRWEEREAILERNRDPRRVRSGLGHRAMISLIERQFLTGLGGLQGLGLGGGGQTILGPDGQPIDTEDCVIA